MDAERIIAETKHIRIIERKPSTKAGKIYVLQVQNVPVPGWNKFFSREKAFQAAFQEIELSKKDID